MQGGHASAGAGGCRRARRGIGAQSGLMARSLRGQLLIAAPSLFDYFRRSVILVLEHSDDGAMGVVLNRRSETLVAEAVPALAALPGAEEAVYVGGPVAPALGGGPGRVRRPERGRHPRDRLARHARPRPAEPLAPAAARVRRLRGLVRRASSTRSSRRAPGSWSAPTPRIRSPRATSGPRRCVARAASTRSWPRCRATRRSCQLQRAGSGPLGGLPPSAGKSRAIARTTSRAGTSAPSRVKCTPSACREITRRPSIRVIARKRPPSIVV